MEYIKSKISEDLAKKILGSQDNAIKYLTHLSEHKEVDGLLSRVISRGKNKGLSVSTISTENIWKVVVNTWNYELSKDIIREIFKETEKYKNGKNAHTVMEMLVKEWETLRLGEIAWPFSQGEFDSFVQRVNCEGSTGIIKDEKVKAAAVKYRRIKEINTVRNDFIETLIFEKNENILPTLNHRRGVDFFINGISFDQKVAKSPTNQFKTKFKDNWKQQAINNPTLVAEYLYEYQDEGRFGSDPRLLIVYLDEDVSIDRIQEIIKQTDLSHPLEINFNFKHKTQGAKSYTVPCFVILLRN